MRADQRSLKYAVPVLLLVTFACADEDPFGPSGRLMQVAGYSNDVVGEVGKPASFCAFGYRRTQGGRPPGSYEARDPVSNWEVVDSSMGRIIHPVAPFHPNCVEVEPLRPGSLAVVATVGGMKGTTGPLRITPPVGAVIVEPSTVRLRVGETIDVSARVVDESGLPIEDLQLVAESANREIASAFGLTIMGIAPGITTTSMAVFSRRSKLPTTPRGYVVVEVIPP